MSFDIISNTEPKARNEYRCIWCNEPILKGETHRHLVGKFYGDFQDQRFHHECWDANQRFFSENKEEEEFSAGEFKRGTIEAKF